MVMCFTSYMSYCVLFSFVGFWIGKKRLTRELKHHWRCMKWNYWSAKYPSFVFTTTWRRHQMETFSALLVLCAGNSPITGEFPSQRPVTRSFDVFFDLRLNKRLDKQSCGWWFATPSRSLWRHCNDMHKVASYLEFKHSVRSSLLEISPNKIWLMSVVPLTVIGQPLECQSLRSSSVQTQSNGLLFGSIISGFLTPCGLVLVSGPVF